MPYPHKKISEWTLREGSARSFACREWTGEVHLGHLWQWPLTIDVRTNMKLNPTGEFTVVCARCETYFRTGPL